MSKLLKIIKSKLINKDNLGDWYHKRVETCLGCEFLSDEKEDLSLKDNLFKIANFGNSFCTECGCGVKDKSSVETEYCPKGKWLSLDINKNASKLGIINLSENVAKISYDNQISQYTLDYGDIKIGSPTNIRLLLNTNGEVIKSVRTSTSCGCTKSEPKKVENGYEFGVSYKSSLGRVKQTIKINYIDSKDKLKLIIINLRGNITR